MGTSEIVVSGGPFCIRSPLNGEGRDFAEKGEPFPGAMSGAPGHGLGAAFIGGIPQGPWLCPFTWPSLYKRRKTRRETGADFPLSRGSRFPPFCPGVWKAGPVRGRTGAPNKRPKGAAAAEMGESAVFAREIEPVQHCSDRLLGKWMWSPARKERQPAPGGPGRSFLRAVYGETAGKRKNRGTGGPGTAGSCPKFTVPTQNSLVTGSKIQYNKPILIRRRAGHRPGDLPPDNMGGFCL